MADVFGDWMHRLAVEAAVRQAKMLEPLVAGILLEHGVESVEELVLVVQREVTTAPHTFTERYWYERKGAEEETDA